MVALTFLIVAVAGYLLGSVPTGFLVAKTRGVDIRTVGSKNMGATNVFRVLGKGPGILVLLVDALKGFAAVVLVVNFYPELNGLLPVVFPLDGVSSPDLRWNLGIIAGLGSVLGHNYTCWLGFKGGKGIATSAGVYIALALLPVGIALAVWMLLFLTTRDVSIASIGGAAALPVAVWLTQQNLLLGIVTTLIGALAIYKHKANIQRLIAGTESRFTFKKQKAES